MPRVAAALGFSGNLSITRKRYSSGHRMKSAAREGDNEAAGTDFGGPSEGSAFPVVVPVVVPMAKTLRPATDSRTHTIDVRAPRTA
ncbi:hypothetical protein GCM10009548_52290 [Streptomyces malaysiensis subsp. malaysiensis]